MSYRGFEPYIDKDSKILILGSFPSVLSRADNFYYGNPRNRFWAVIAEACGDVMPKTSDEKKAFLTRHKIALWDMVTECEIKGSLDSGIKDYKIADIAAVIQKYGDKKIFTNGAKAAELLKRYYPQYANNAVFLPSTSPANARFDKAVWLSELKDFIRS